MVANRYEGDREEGYYRQDQGRGAMDREAERALREAHGEGPSPSARDFRRTDDRYEDDRYAREDDDRMRGYYGRTSRSAGGTMPDTERSAGYRDGGSYDLGLGGGPGRGRIGDDDYAARQRRYAGGESRQVDRRYDSRPMGGDDTGDAYYGRDRAYDGPTGRYADDGYGAERRESHRGFLLRGAVVPVGVVLRDDLDPSRQGADGLRPLRREDHGGHCRPNGRRPRPRRERGQHPRREAGGDARGFGQRPRAEAPSGGHRLRRLRREACAEQPAHRLSGFHLSLGRGGCRSDLRAMLISCRERFAIGTTPPRPCSWVTEEEACP